MEKFGVILIQVLALSTGVTLSRFLNPSNCKRRKCVSMRSNVLCESPTAASENRMSDNKPVDC